MASRSTGTLSRALRTVRWRLEAAGMDLCTVAAAALAPPRRARVGAALGTVLRMVDRRHARVAAANMRAVFGASKSAEEVDRLVAGCFRHFVQAGLDVFATARADDDVLERCAIEGTAHVDLARARARGGAVIFCAAHFGLWEIAALVGGRRFPLAVVARPLDNPLLDARLERIRTRWGNRVIAKRGAIVEALQALRRGVSVALLIDQRPKTAGLVMPFLGRDAHVRPTLAALALRTGAPIVPVSCRREVDGTWRLVFEPEVQVDRTGEYDTDVWRIMDACHRRVERWILDTPEQWLWTHARWREPRHHAAVRPRHKAAAASIEAR